MEKFKMDDLKDDFGVYKGIFVISSALMIFLVQIYLIFISNGVDILNFKNIQNVVLRIVLQVIIQIIGFSFVNVLVFWIVFKVKEKIWIFKHKNMWFKGEWLHIHDKKNVRIGKVTIKQKFFKIEADASNLSPNISNNTKITNWYYQSSQLYPKGLPGIEFVGSYVADDQENETYKLGIHIFDSMSCINGYPSKLTGRFSDTFKIYEEKAQDGVDKKGLIYFFKVTPRIRNCIYDNNEINYEKLANIVHNDSLKNEGFVIKLKEVLEKHGYDICKI